MKIILFDGTYKTTSFINRLATALSKKHEVFILGFNESLKYRIKDIHYVPLGSNQSSWRLFIVSIKYAINTMKISNVFKVLKNFFLKEKRSLQKQNLDYVLNKINPDIIHLQWLSNIFLFEKYLIDSKYKFILSQRGFHVNVRPFVNQYNMKYLRKWYPKLSGFHSVSKAMTEVSNKIYSSENKIDKVVYSGIDFSDFNFKNVTEKLDTVKIISVGRDHWIKGYIYAIKAMAILKKQNVEFHYTIIGVSKKSEELIYIINYFDLQEYITFVDVLNQEEVYQLIQEQDLLILPSLEEGIANVCIEAMALGTLVVSTNCGGMEELITNNETGFIVPTRNANAIAEKIAEIKYMNNDIREFIRKNARLKVEIQHNETKMIADMENLYKMVYESN